VLLSGVRVKIGNVLSRNDFRPAWVFDSVFRSTPCVLKVELGENTQVAHECEVLRSLQNLHGIPRVILSDITPHMGAAVMVPKGEPLSSQKRPWIRESLGRVLLDVVDILEKAHTRGFAHCDVSPDNIILHASGTVLIDWGAALPLQTVVNFVGKQRFASERLLAALRSGLIVPVTPGDDFTSVLHVLDFMLGSQRTQRNDVEDANVTRHIIRACCFSSGTARCEEKKGSVY
jgi:serine/threonine protein kinase